jgi:hypothetical protein
MTEVNRIVQICLEFRSALLILYAWSRSSHSRWALFFPFFPMFVQLFAHCLLCDIRFVVDFGTITLGRRALAGKHVGHTITPFPNLVYAASIWNVRRVHALGVRSDPWILQKLFSASLTMHMHVCKGTPGHTRGPSTHPASPATQ